jgi:DNA-binding SARP family transcriptional activator/tetratricopeptide (TPR) repeat protein
VAEFRLLGPVELRSAAGPVALGTPRQRSVLAALAVDVGRSVLTETLLERVWGSSPPERARRTLYVYVTRIRTAIRAAGAVDGHAPRLVSRARGYALDAEPDSVDMHRFQQLVSRARDPDGPMAERSAALREALDLWRGPPLADVPGEWADAVRVTWRQHHIDAATAWADVEQRLGRGAAIAGPLADLAAGYPLDESLAAAQMRTLASAGRRAEALQCFMAIRRRLVEQLGIEPSPHLHEIHRTILRDEPDAPSATAPRTAATRRRSGPHRTSTGRQARASGAGQRGGTVLPAQLPSAVPGFTGRARELDDLDALVTADPTSGLPRAVVISAVSGTAGVGKTALAVYWAHRVRPRFPDGQLYMNLRGFDPGGHALAPAEAIRALLDALGVLPERVPPSLDAQAGLYRSLLSEKRVLLLLDNARDADQVRPLLPGSPSCFVVVTSRSRLTGLVAMDGAHPLALDVLSTVEARTLLARRLGASRVASERQAAEQVVARCARLPLALTIAAARAQQAGLGLAAVAAELDQVGDRLDALDTGERSSQLRAVFSWSYAALSREAARLFRLLGLHSGADISASAAASLAGSPLAKVAPLLAELMGANLIVEHIPGRYAFHDLLRAYASERARDVDRAPVRRAAVHRLLDHYLHTGYAAARLLQPGRDSIVIGRPQRGVGPEEIADYEQAFGWFSAEQAVLMAAINHAAASGFDTHTWQLAWTVDDFLDWRGHWQDRVVTLGAAVAASDRLTDVSTQARTRRLLALAFARLGRFDEAHTQLREALVRYRKDGDQAGQAHTHHSLARVRARQGNDVEALDHARQALDLYRAVDHRLGQANTLNSIGWYHAQLGDYEQALAACEQAVVMHRGLDYRHGHAAAWDSLGYARHHLGHHAQAVTCFEYAVAMYEDLGDRYQVANSLARLGDTLHAAGDHPTAHDAWNRALDILTDLEHPDAERVRARIATIAMAGHAGRTS